jgi:hypothetical protein
MNDVDIWTIFEKKYQKLVFLIKFQSLLRQATTQQQPSSSPSPAAPPWAPLALRFHLSGPGGARSCT